ncbi:MAG: ROK family transcriptional regulator [bacterium]|nr:ROK family transcriptional regulator [bacterium]
MLSGTRLEDTRIYNRKIVIETIRRSGPIVRAEIARMTGLTTATISNLTAELKQEEIILETGRRKGQRGQPAIDLEVNPNGRFAIGFELGRDVLSGVLINLAGEVLGKVHKEWEYPTPEVALPHIAGGVKSLLEQTTIPEEHLLGVGVAMPGYFSVHGQQFVLSPQGFPHWEQFPIQKKLSELLNFTVVMENDVMAAAMGEQFHGAGRQYKDFFYMYLGAGIGGAMIHNGHPYQGFSPDTGALGWIKHISKGQRSRLGSYVGLAQLYDFLKGYGITVSHPKELEKLFERQNSCLWEWLNEMIECLDTVLDAVNALLGPEVVFLGGHFPVPIVNYLIERLELENTAKTASQPQNFCVYTAKLLRAKSGDISSALGAATLPLYHTFSTQSTLLSGDSSQ